MDYKALNDLVNAIEIFVDKPIDPTERLDQVAKLVYDQEWLLGWINDNTFSSDKVNKTSYLTRKLHLKEFQASQGDPKIREFIFYLHAVVYDLFEEKGNFDFQEQSTASVFTTDKTDSKAEMAGLKKEIYYIVNVYKKSDEYMKFYLFVITMALESKINNHLYIGYDLEYTMNVVQLYQLNYEHNYDHRSFIFVASPSLMGKKIHDVFIDLNIINTKITKILHGSDSKDLPYIYEQMLGNDSQKIIKFTRSMIETRWICEYYKLNNGDSNDNKCDLYHAVWYFKLISTEKYDELQQIIVQMGSPSDIVWNIIWLDKPKTKYAYYDVIFLKYFYYQMIQQALDDLKESKQTTPTRKQLLQFYHYFMYELTQFVYLEKKNITNLTETCKLEGDLINNYMIRDKKGNTFRLNDVFLHIMSFKGSKDKINLVILDPYVDVEKLFKINYFRKNLTYVLKKMCFTILNGKFQIKKDKNTFWDGKMSNTWVYNMLTDMKFPLIEKFFRQVETVFIDRINQAY